MSISETELSDILKIIRQLERVIENALKDEREKNEDKIVRHLNSQGIEVVDDWDGTYLTHQPTKPEGGVIRLRQEDIDDWNMNHPSDPVEIIEKYVRIETTEPNLDAFEI